MKTLSAPLSRHPFLRLFLGLLFGPLASASPGGKIHILGVEELAPRLSSVTVLDAREERSFRLGHLPGSQSVSWKDWTVEKASLLNYFLGDSSKWGKVADLDETLQTRLRALGLTRTKPIVVVGSPHEWGEEGRIAWNLLYWGAGEVILLDGGYPEWVARGKPVEKGKAKRPAPGDFVVSLRPQRRASLQTVKTAVRSHSRQILDARSAEEYAGKLMAGQKRGGHLPGAVLVPELSLYHKGGQKDGHYLAANELKELVRIPLRGTPISYCTGGVRSALLALVVEARLGIALANYDGSIWEWASHPELPLETGK